jgi:predicted transcriptional regulator
MAVAEAADVIRGALEIERVGARRVYSAFFHHCFNFVYERRLDDEARDWQALAQGIRAKLADTEPMLAERFVVLSDLLRELTNIAEANPVAEVIERPQAKKILDMLKSAKAPVPSERIRTSTGMSVQNLSNAMRRLIGLGLVHRYQVGKSAEFELTKVGRKALGITDAAKAPTADSLMNESAVAAMAAAPKTFTTTPALFDQGIFEVVSERVRTALAAAERQGAYRPNAEPHAQSTTEPPLSGFKYMPTGVAA